MVRLGDMEIRLKRNEVLVHGRYVNLTPKEFQIIGVSRQSCGGGVLGPGHHGQRVGRGLSAESASIAVFVRKIRNKIEDDPSKPRYLQTIWREGYRLGDASMIEGD